VEDYGFVAFSALLNSLETMEIGIKIMIIGTLPGPIGLQAS